MVGKCQGYAAWQRLSLREESLPILVRALRADSGVKAPGVPDGLSDTSPYVGRPPDAQRLGGCVPYGSSDTNTYLMVPWLSIEPDTC